MGISSDLPIAKPSDDRFGLDPFASALATSIARMEAPAGVVLAINGAWGSGKSSAINLIKHHLQASVDADELAVVPFNPWWFAGTDALTLAFFQELNKAIGPSLPQKLRKSIAAMGQGVSAAGAVLGALANLKVPGLGEVISGATGMFGKMTALDQTVEEAHSAVSEALGKQKKRFLVVIDDIDRLNPDDALTIFRLVKSVGRLPNVIYLLAFDRQIAERIVAERFPSEGASYLEKILQGAFELPPPLVDVLRYQCAEAAFKIMGEPEEARSTRFWNVFQDVVSPTIRTPRDVIRLSNQLSATWPAVSGNVDRADFLAITALQLAEPTIYDAIRQHPADLCGLRQLGAAREQDIAQQYDTLLALTGRSERDRRRLRIALRRLFPRLDAVWGNTYHADEQWRRYRLIASAENFRSYFTFSVSEDVIPAEVIQELVARADERAFVTELFRGALAIIRRTGASQASLLLEELQVYAADVDDDKVASLTQTLFALADELHVDSDVLRGFGGMGNNQFRLHWLFNRLIHDRFSQEQRAEIYRAAMDGAAVEWATDFTERCLRPYEPQEEDEQSRDEPIVTQEVAEEFRALSLAKVRAAAEDGTLIQHRRLTTLLFTWRRLAGENGTTEVRAWTDRVLADPAFVLALVRDLPSSSWSFGMGMDEMGDRVQRQTFRVNLAPYGEILDLLRFDARIAEILQAGELSETERAELVAFNAIPRGSHRRRDD